jgi:hypothetical protein
VNNWEEGEKYIKPRNDEARREIVWWKTRVWRQKGVRKKNEQRICPVCSKGGGVWSHILRCEGTKISRNQILNKSLGVWIQK